MAEQKATNIIWHQGAVTRADRERLSGHRSATVWFTGLSGSGKSTIAVALEKALWERGVHAFVLDGDNVRHGLNQNLGFSPADRSENIRRIGEVAKLFTDAGVIVMTSFISPYRGDRDAVRAIMGKGDFVEVHVQASVETCEGRDVKGLYKKARAGEIPEFTGISAPYEAPLSPELVLDTQAQSVEQRISALERAIAKDETSPLLHRMMAESLARSGDLERAVEHARRARELAPDDPGVRSILAQLYRIQENSGDAEKLLLDAQGKPIDEESAWLLYQIYLEANQFDAGLGIARWMTEKSPEEPRGWIA